MDAALQDPRLKAALQAATDSSPADAASNGTESAPNGLEAAASPSGSTAEHVAATNGTAAAETSGAAGLFAPSSPSETAATAQVAESAEEQQARLTWDREELFEQAEAEAENDEDEDEDDAALPESTEEPAAIKTEATAPSDAAAPTVPEGTSTTPAVSPTKPEPSSQPPNETASQSLSPPPPVFTERAPVPPTRKAPQSRLALLKQSVEKDPSDGEAWLELIADAEKKGDLEKTREVYQSFLEHFPDAVSRPHSHRHFAVSDVRSSRYLGTAMDRLCESRARARQLRRSRKDLFAMPQEVGLGRPLGVLPQLRPPDQPARGGQGGPVEADDLFGLRVQLGPYRHGPVLGIGLARLHQRRQVRRRAPLPSLDDCLAR